MEMLDGKRRNSHLPSYAKAEKLKAQTRHAIPLTDCFSKRYELLVNGIGFWVSGEGL